MEVAELLTPAALDALDSHVQVQIWCAANGMTFAALCRELGVDQGLAWKVVRGKVRANSVSEAISRRTGVMIP